MPYAEGRVVHDADSHVVETPEWFEPYADPAIRARMDKVYVSVVKPGEEQFIDVLRQRRVDPADRPRADAEIMVRKNWSAMGSFVKEIARAPSTCSASRASWSSTRSSTSTWSTSSTAATWS
jgi:hypothetical protein